MIDKNMSQAKCPMTGWTLWVAIAALFLAAVVSYFSIDESFFSWLTRHPCKWASENLGNTFRLLGKVLVPIWLLLFWSLTTRCHRPALVGLLALLMAFVFVLPLKALTQRQRPDDGIRTTLLGNQAVDARRAPHHSFPSGDTASVFAVAAALSVFVTCPWVVLLFAAAGGIGFLRLIDWAHYPSDVFAGAAIGIFCGWLALQIDRRWLSSLPLHPRSLDAVCLLGLVLIPVLMGLLQGRVILLVFLKTYVPLAVALYIIAAIPKRLKPREPCK